MSQSGGQVERSGGSTGSNNVETQPSGPRGSSCCEVQQSSGPGEPSENSVYYSKSHSCDCNTIVPIFMLTALVLLILERIYSIISRAKS